MSTKYWSAGLALLLAVAPAAAGDPPGAKLLYEHGDPTDEQQLLLEVINRARDDPAREGERIFRDYDSDSIRQTVDFFIATVSGEPTRDVNRRRFTFYGRRPPLALNAALTQAADGWSAKMRDDDMPLFDPDLARTIIDAGYSSRLFGQLITTNVPDMLHAHASWVIDWGQQVRPSNGQVWAPNRAAVLNFRDVNLLRYVEAGIGVATADASNVNVGPRIVTLNLGAPSDPDRVFVTGVCYADLDFDGEYDPGEGRAGVRIDVEPSDFFAITSTSGGYAVPASIAAGDLRITARPPIAGSEPILQTSERQTSARWLKGRGTNMKADFLLDERGSAPVFESVAGTGGPLGNSDAFGVAVPSLDPARPNVGDIDVHIDVQHPDRSQLTVTLVSPLGTRAMLWNRGASGAGLRGEFDASLQPAEPLAAFVGESYAGTWILEVEDARSGTVGAVLSNWSLSIRPAWESAQHAPRTPLAVRTLKIDRRKKPGKHKLVLDASFDTGRRFGATVDVPVTLVLRDLAGAAHLIVDLTADPAPADGPRTKMKLSLDRNNTSRSRLIAKAKRLDLSDLPRNLRVELAVGDAVLAQAVPVRSGRYRATLSPPLEHLFRIDRLRSRQVSEGWKTVIKGRLNAPAGLGNILTGAEVVVGDFRARVPPTQLRNVAGALVHTSPGDLRRLVIDPITGRFEVRIVGVHDAVPGGVSDVALTIGSFHGDTRIAPHADSVSVTY